MSNFRPLEHQSQGTVKTPVLYLDQGAQADDLMEAASWRLGAARGLLEALSACTVEDGYERLLGDATRAVLLLIDDADSLFHAARFAPTPEGRRHD